MSYTKDWNKSIKDYDEIAGSVSRRLKKLKEKDAEKGEPLKTGSLKGGKSEPFTKAPPGEGGRFEACTAQMEKEGKSKESATKICAAINRAKFGAKGAGDLATPETEAPASSSNDKPLATCPECGEMHIPPSGEKNQVPEYKCPQCGKIFTRTQSA